MNIANILKLIQELYREGYSYDQRLVLTDSFMLKVINSTSGAIELHLVDNRSMCAKLAARWVVQPGSDITAAYNQLIGEAVISERKRFTAVDNELNCLFLG
jgi:hypothetical protein